MKLSRLHESYLHLLTARQADKELGEAIEAAYQQILDDHPNIRNDHQINQALLKALTRMHEQRDDLKDTDPFEYAYQRFDEIVRQRKI